MSEPPQHRSEDEWRVLDLRAVRAELEATRDAHSRVTSAAQRAALLGALTAAISGVVATGIGAVLTSRTVIGVWYEQPLAAVLVVLIPTLLTVLAMATLLVRARRRSRPAPVIWREADEIWHEVIGARHRTRPRRAVRPRIAGR